MKLTKDSAFFIFDVESVGLHGQAFAVGGGIYLGNGAAQREFRFACPIDACDGAESDRKWVKENVPVLEQTHHAPAVIRKSFWEEWMKAKRDYPEIIMAVECGWPVEARFLCACIDDEPEARRWAGPYPLHEIASIMEAAGMDAMKTYERTPSEPAHDPLGDSRLSARLLAEAISKTAQ